MVGRDASLVAGQRAKLSVRPEDVRIRLGAHGEQGIPVQVISVRDMGSTIEARLNCDGHQVLSIIAPRDRDSLEAGQAAHLVLAPDACRVLME
jgi:putative spermidine/putrescine transport system ATP-binding protein